MTQSRQSSRLERATEAVVETHDAELKAYLAGDVPANQWRPEQYAAAVIDALDASLGFRDLVEIAQKMLATTYPEDVFGSGPLSLDSGAQFTIKLREALRCVHAEPKED